MITEWTTPFVERKAEYVAWLGTVEYPTYSDLLKRSLEIAVEGKEPDYRNPLPDPERITVVDNGDYQGTFVFVIAEQGYQPDRYWYTMVDYGSCSGCDSLEDARGYSSETRNVEAMYSLTLHMLQGAKAMER